MPYRHLLLICDALLKAIYDPLSPKNIMVTMPPRSGKSELISHWIPVWFLENFPEKRVLLAAYEADFAAEWGRKVRDTILNNADSLRVRISPTSSSASRWNTASIDPYTNKLRQFDTGGMRTTGLGGAATGKGGELMIGDDLVKNAEEAASQNTRDAIWDFVTSTFFTRKEPNAVTLLVMTRWNEDDPVGRIREKLADPNYTGGAWTQIDMPALCVDETNDPLHRKLGEALCPERYDRKALLEIKGDTDEWVWESLYQQNPKPPGGVIVDSTWWGTTENPRMQYPPNKIIPNSTFFFNHQHIIARFQSWDTALKDKDNSAYSICETFDLLDDYKLVLRDVYRDKPTFDLLPDLIIEQAVKWNQDHLLEYGNIVIENKASGISALQTLAAFAPEWMRSLLVPWEQNTDKITRMKQMSVWLRRESLWLPLPSPLVPWRFMFTRELFDFPGSKFKDQVDTLSQILQYLERYLEEGWRNRRDNQDNINDPDSLNSLNYYQNEQQRSFGIGED